MVPSITDAVPDQQRIAKATWQAALLRQLADDLEREQSSQASPLSTALLADAVELPEGTQIVFTLREGRPPSIEVRGPNTNHDAFFVSVHP